MQKASLYAMLGDLVYKLLFVMVVLSGAYFSFVKCSKPEIMYQNYLDHTHYKIFPWSEPSQQQMSKSNPLWLLIHILDAYLHVVLTGLVYFTRRTSNNQTLFKISHYVFIGIIAINLQHAGNQPILKAILFNGIPWLTAILTFDPTNRVWWKSLIYFIAVSSAILFETGMYLTR